MNERGRDIGVDEPAVAERAERFRGMFDDQEAFRHWYDGALPIVYGFVLARCGAEGGTAVEITQEAFVEAVRQRARFTGASDPITWVCGIARHKVADHFRRLERERRRHLRLLGREAAPAVQPGDAVEDRAVVTSALRSLPQSQRAVLAMHYLDGMPVRDVATALGRSESAVESLLARARETFRRTYESVSGGRDER